MMPDLVPPETIDLSIHDGRPINLRYIGPGCHGWIYWNEGRTAVYRILSVRGSSGRDSFSHRRSDDAPIERRYDIIRWTKNGHAERDRPDWLGNPNEHCLIAPTKAFMTELPGYGSSFVIWYDTPCKQNLAEVLIDSNPLVRIARMVQVFRSQNHWLACLGPCRQISFSLGRNGPCCCASRSGNCRIPMQ
jgi:hypothetical protein